MLSVVLSSVVLVSVVELVTVAVFVTVLEATFTFAVGVLATTVTVGGRTGADGAEVARERCASPWLELTLATVRPPGITSDTVTACASDGPSCGR